MDGVRFDRLTKSLAAALTRRSLTELFLAMPLGGLLADLGRETIAARRDHHRHRTAGEQGKHRGKHKKKHRHRCAKNGKKPGKGQKCCSGLVKDGSGRCVPPAPASCANSCSGCCSGNTCIVATSAATCGAKGAPCVACANPTPFCLGATCGACTASSQCPAGTLCDGGTCVPCDVCVRHCAFTSIQVAIDDPATQDGDTIRICAGAYPENVTVDKSLTLIGAGDEPDGSVLDGTGAGTAVTIVPAVSATLRNLRITGGSAGDHGGFFIGGGIFNNGDLTLTRCTVTGNNAGDFGGGIYSEFISPLTMTGCTVSDNNATTGGGGIYANDTLTMTDCLVASNKALSGSGGGVFSARDASSSLTDCTVQGNTASVSGGGIFGAYPDSGPGSVTLNGCSILNNTVTGGEGGGITTEGTVTLNDCRVSSNSASVRGGGIRKLSAGVDPGTVTLNDSNVTSNHSDVGGGIYVGDGEVILNGGSNVTSNTASGFTGAGIHIESSGSVTLNDTSQVTNNTGVSNGGGVLNDGSLTLNASSRVQGNSAGAGGGIFNGGTGTVEMNGSSIVTLNEATLGAGSGGGIFNDGSTTLNGSSSIVLNTPDNCGGSVAVTGCTG